ncbi:MAG: class I SAM-dependent methyltransferase [Sphingomonadaceae bacterium]
MHAEILGKRSYVSVMRALKGAMAPTGLLDGEPDVSEERYRHWLQSLFAIYDIDALIRLDVPWWTYDAIDAVEQFLGQRTGARVYEYGSGASTVWLTKRAGKVLSVDHDKDWIEFSAPRLAELGNATVAHVPADATARPGERCGSGKSGYSEQTFTDYVRSIDAHEGQFDLIVIDGRARAACLRHAAGRLAPNGMIVFDNSHRRRYRPAIADSGLGETVLRGLVPSLPLPDQTSLLRQQ